MRDQHDPRLALARTVVAHRRGRSGQSRSQPRAATQRRTQAPASSTPGLMQSGTDRAELAQPA
jgi:hypothetical protein